MSQPQLVCNYRRHPYSCFTDIKLLQMIIDGYIRNINSEKKNLNIMQYTIPQDINKMCIPYILETNSYFTIYDETHACLQTIYEQNKPIITTNISNDEQSLDANDYCYICVGSGELICCDSCPNASHLFCAGLLTVPNSEWFCGYCMIKKPNPFKQYQLLQGKNTNDFTTDIIFISEIQIYIGVHELIFQCIKTHPNDKIGIICFPHHPNEEIDLNKLKTQQLGKIYLYNDAFGKHTYYWWRHTKNIRSHNKRIRLQGIAKWDVGSVIKMIIDCNNWSLKYYHNQCSSQVISIDKNVKYYAVLAMGDAHSMYRYNIS
eukprot:302003_1